MVKRKANSLRFNFLLKLLKAEDNDEDRERRGYAMAICLLRFGSVRKREKGGERSLYVRACVCVRVVCLFSQLLGLPSPH